MRTIVVFAYLLLLTIVLCSGTSLKSKIIKVDADSIVADINKYEGKTVETEGVIIHICSMGMQKMKLKTHNDAIIKIISNDSLNHFSDIYLQKKIKVIGVVEEYRVEKDNLDKLGKVKALLCHIDYAPCKDTEWVNSKIKSGESDSISKKVIEKLNSKMKQSGKNYISVITIIAEKVEIIE